jgi:hypothetical protein
MKKVDNKLTEYESFYKNGFEIFRFDPCGLDEILKEILDGNLKKGFSLQQKYSNTIDLRPSAVDYSEKFIKALKINQIKSFIRSRTLRDLTLYHAQVRVASSTISYMNWHRDSYYDLERKSGMSPPGYKIIYYPSFNNQIEQRLYVAPGSHRIMIDQQVEDLKLVSKLPKAIISTNNEQALLFDTSLLHAVAPDLPGTSSIRLIYSFIAPEQLRDANAEELHHKTSKMYEEET